MPRELRQFVYLDSLSVNSLLASLYIAVPDTIREISQTTSEEGLETGVEGSIGIQELAQISGQIGGSESEESSELSEINRKVNDQYRFSLLHQALTSEDLISDLNQRPEEAGESLSFEQGDVVKIQGECKSDSFFRYLNVAALFMRINPALEYTGEETLEDQLSDELETSVEDPINVFGEFLDGLYADRIGLKLESENLVTPFGMVLDLKNLWAEPEREFLGSREYTVVGRIDREIPRDAKWDIIDLLRIAQTIFTDDTMADLRNGFENVSLGSDFDVVEGDYVIEGPLVIVDPIAIYW